MTRSRSLRSRESQAWKDSRSLLAHVIATEAGKHVDLDGREPPQVPVLYEVGTVACVTVTADVFTDVMQQGGQLEKLSVLDVEAVQSHCRVEQFEGQLGDLAGMGLRPPRAHAQRHDPARRIALGFLLSSTRSWRAMLEMMIPSRRPHSDTVSSRIPVLSINTSATAAPAGRSSAAGVDARQSPTFVGRAIHR